MNPTGLHAPGRELLGLFEPQTQLGQVGAMTVGG